MITSSCIAVIHIHKTNISGNIVNNNDKLQWTNKHLLYKNIISHFILERVDIGCVWEVNWRRGQTATYWPKVILTIAALLSHFGWAAQPWVTESPKPSVCRWLSRWHLVPNWLKPSVSWLFFCLTSTCFRVFTQVHLLIDSSVEVQYVTPMFIPFMN